MTYGYKVVYPPSEFLTESGYERVAHIPCIFDGRPGYDRNASRFLVDRALGVWDPKNRGRGIQQVPPTQQSIQNYAEWLVNYLDWCKARSIEPLRADYIRDILGRYQTEMLKGIWSATGRPLSEGTVNLRVGVAVEFLTWAGDKGVREPFSAPTSTRYIKIGSATSSVSHKPVAVESRRGKLREAKRRLGFPPEEELAAWFRAIAKKPEVGDTESLICATILETAIRREEAACLRVDFLPRNPEDWEILNRSAAPENQSVVLEIRYGAKGKSYGSDHGDKIGPVGTIRMSLSLALKLHKYRESARLEALRIAIKKGKTRAEQAKVRDESVHLFLNPKTGLRYSGKQIYTLWRSVPHPQQWSPHLARDYWACMTLLRRMQQQRELLEHALKKDVPSEILGSIRSSAESVIMMEIQPQLRHASRETTMIYLQWLSDHLSLNLNLHEKWVDQLSDGGFV
ncbi:MAG: hypothetical protein VB032_09580 [Burkholderiaceae bacterium]|nr:hypothetical protein [Burkholderiaceae bacterium]